MRRSIQLIGHRGARGLFPENTLAGFAGALAIGVDAIELDVTMTADGVVVATHDPALNPDQTRGPDGGWLRAPGPLIRSLPAAALGAYDVGRLRPGSAVARRFPDQAPCDGTRIPTLAEVLTMAPGVRFVIELKTFPGAPSRTAPVQAMAEAVLEVVESAGCTDRVIVESLDWRGPRHLHRLRPRLGLALLTDLRRELQARLWHTGPRGAGRSVPHAVAAEGVAAWGPDHRTLTRARLAEAHQLGLAVIPWTVNRPADLRRLIAWGVDGLVTDRPDLARMALAEAGHPLPPPLPPPEAPPPEAPAMAAPRLGTPPPIALPPVTAD
jgi:glycerophosphoryl diester phosphodiesterase